MKMRNIVVFLGIILFSISCSEVNEPVLQYTTYKYIGNIGTERSYIETERWYKSNSDSTYYRIPDSLLSLVSIDSEEQKDGVTIIDKYTESNVPIDEYLYQNWELPSPQENYLQIESFGESYSLSDELDSLLQSKTYLPWQHQFSGTTYQITSEGVLTVIFKLYQKIFPSCVYLKNDMDVGDTWVIYQHIDTLTNNVIEEKIAEIVSKENISVKAGDFSSFKIKITDYYYNSLTSIIKYEYYVPNVGLVLSEFEGDFKLRIIDLLTNSIKTLEMYRIVRKELVSYSFVK